MDRVFREQQNLAGGQNGSSVLTRMADYNEMPTLDYVYPAGQMEEDHTEYFGGTLSARFVCLLVMARAVALSTSGTKSVNSRVSVESFREELM